MTQHDPESDAEVHTLGLLEELHADSGQLWQTASDLYFRVDKLLRKLQNPNLHDIRNMHHKVELWDRHALHVRWMIAACGTVTIGRAAFEAAVKSWPDQRFTLRNGMQLILEHDPKDPTKKVNE